MSINTLSLDKSFFPQFDATRGPSVFTARMQPAHLGDIYRGASAFLVCGGPSLNQLNLSWLNERGILSCSLNNAAALFRTNIWIAFDHPGKFSESIWNDPAVMKFIQLGRLKHNIRVRDDGNQLIDSKLTAGDMPNTFGYRCNSEFCAERWLSEDTINCGHSLDTPDSIGIKGGRSVMMVAIKLLYFLGVRRISLLGCDFKMKYGNSNYAFEQGQTRKSVRGNNYMYRTLNARLQALKPKFDEAGFAIYNCTPNSGLTVFPFVDYRQAIEDALEGHPTSIQTEGMYDEMPQTA